MPQLAIDLVELAVGGVCFGVGVAAWRRGLGAVAAIFTVAGAAAAIHAVVSIAAG